MMRVMLYEAAQVMLLRSAKWSWLKAWAMKIARRRGMKKAARTCHQSDGKAAPKIVPPRSRPNGRSVAMWTRSDFQRDC
jgi:hypothetical protein